MPCNHDDKQQRRIECRSATASRRNTRGENNPETRVAADRVPFPMAFLVCEFEIVRNKPLFVRASIRGYRSFPETPYLTMCLLEAQGRTFDDAQEEIRRVIQFRTDLHWVRALLPKA